MWFILGEEEYNFADGGLGLAQFGDDGGKGFCWSILCLGSRAELLVSSLLVAISGL
jgi:hypothetical protein